MTKGQNTHNTYFIWVILGSLCIAIGIALAGFFISQTLYKSKIALNTAEVKGLAQRRVEADKAYWLIRYRVSGNSAEQIPLLYSDSEAAKQKIIALLQENGFSLEEIAPGVIDYQKNEFRDESQRLV